MTHAHPTRGRVLLLGGAVALVLGVVLRDHLSPGRQRGLVLVVGVLALLAAIEAVHVIQLVRLSEEIVPLTVTSSA